MSDGFQVVRITSFPVKCLSLMEIAAASTLSLKGMACTVGTKSSILVYQRPQLLSRSWTMNVSDWPALIKLVFVCVFVVIHVSELNLSCIHQFVVLLNLGEYHERACNSKA